MEKEQLTHLKKRLENMRSKEMESMNHIRDGLRNTMRDSVGELSLNDNHPADLGDVTFEREKDLGLILFTEDRLAMIEEALNNIETGKYGLCEDCGREISHERLEAIPYTTLCQDCKKKYEGLERHPRPIEEDVIDLPWGGLDIHKTSRDHNIENNAFDGEDAWQAAARYGTSNSPSDIGSVDDYDDTYVDSFEDIGTVEDYESIASHKEKDGQLYKNFKGKDDEEPPYNWVNE